MIIGQREDIFIGAYLTLGIDSYSACRNQERERYLVSYIAFRLIKSIFPSLGFHRHTRTALRSKRIPRVLYFERGYYAVQFLHCRIAYKHVIERDLPCTLRFDRHRHGYSVSHIRINRYLQTGTIDAGHHRFYSGVVDLEQEMYLPVVLKIRIEGIRFLCRSQGREIITLDHGSGSHIIGRVPSPRSGRRTANAVEERSARDIHIRMERSGNARMKPISVFYLHLILRHRDLVGIGIGV